MNTGRAAAVAVLACVLLMGAIGTFEIWQALTTDVIGIREGGFARAQQPVLFWVSFAVSALIAAPMWLALVFLIVVFALHLVSTKAN